MTSVLLFRARPSGVSLEATSNSFPKPRVREARAVDAARSEVVRDGERTIQGKLVVQLVAARRVGVAAHVDGRRGEVLVQDLRLLVQDGKGLGLEVRPARIEGDLFRVLEDENARQPEPPRHRRDLSFAEADEKLCLLGREDPDAPLDRFEIAFDREEGGDVSPRFDLDDPGRLAEALAAEKYVGLFRTRRHLDGHPEGDLLLRAGDGHRGRERSDEEPPPPHETSIGAPPPGGYAAGQNGTETAKRPSMGLPSAATAGL